MDKAEILCLIGKRIKELRFEKGISQQQLASECNFEKSNLSRIEAGRSNVTIYTLAKIANVLEVKVQDLVTF